MKKRMQKTVQGQKFIIRETDKGFLVETFDTLGGHYKAVCHSFADAGNWVWNMADNHDIAHIVNEKMCDIFQKTFA